MLNISSSALATTYSYSTSNGKTILEILLPILAVVCVIGLLVLVSTWKIFTKAGRPGWAAIIPYYSTYTLFEVAGWNGWIGVIAAFLLTFDQVSRSPAIGGLFFVAYLIVYIMMIIKLAEKFSKSTVFAIFGLLIFPFVGYPMLAFGKAQYKGSTGNSGTADPPLPKVPSSSAAPTPDDQPPQQTT